MLRGYEFKPHSPEGSNEEHPILRGIRTYSQVGATLLLWMKFLYFLRTRKEFGYLIRMIGQVVRDMIPFLVVMGVLVTSFSESIYALDRNKFYADHVHLTFFESFEFIYFNALGSLTMVGFEDDILVWILFFLCSLINLTVMLNLLIAIISETYDKVASTQDEFALQERAGVVADLRDFEFFRWFVKQKD